ncbi:tau 95 subunit of transcription factor TFIIIC [Didymosphaeria variabile]|uniref:Tau 95 subunit of transcription factor TFIIIC n=1 Tax=Didymosphaeria variabile TaxID=1932322 RepID=A0A9W8XBU2_9PLEO|nr:tau 95 subunit of transcription factor TFIIIC [Didymosphaeria variabile]KAJ4346770.1 tau 95 subunit of transcription factor TFIIIC [Didymosphaeria variabile]
MNSMDAANKHGSEDAVEQTAPWLQIPSRAISVVEHPCIIKNIDKGIVSLGGPVKLSKGLRSKLEPQPNAESPDALPKVISVSLRPDDPLAKRLLSTPVATNNLLLKVTVPKRTGRKRKRGSSGPFIADADAGAATGKSQSPQNQHAQTDAATLFRSLQDNASRYDVSVAGVIDETHRFRNLPDLQYAASTNSTMLKIRDHVLPLSFSKLKNFNLNTAAGPDLTKDVGPSAEFLQLPIAYNYRFQQNTFVKYKDDNGAVAEVNLHKSLAWSGYSIIKPNAEGVPMRPKSSLPRESDLTPYVQELIRSIRRELEKRPIITRHLLYNTLGWDKRDRLRQAAVYCGYFFETGPWREALIAWGVDPRTDPKYRFYQTVSFLSYKKTGTARHFTRFDQHVRDLAELSPQELRKQHTFDGVHVSRTGNLFQFCDVTDPLIQRILRTEDIRTTPAPTAQGWFHVGTWAKATVILKHKMNTILAGDKPDDSIYERILAWPELWDDKTFFAEHTKELHDKEAVSRKSVEHTVMKNVRYAAKNPRYAFERLEAQQGQSSGAEHPQTEEVEEDVEVEEDMSEVPERAEDILNEGGSVEDDSDNEVGDEDEDDEEEDELNESVGGVLDEVMDEDEDADGEWEVDDVPTAFGFGGFNDT